MDTKNITVVKGIQKKKEKEKGEDPNGQPFWKRKR
jgi:hypothetical protein